MYAAVVQVFQQRGYKHHGSRLSCCRFFFTLKLGFSPFVITEVTAANHRFGLSKLILNLTSMFILPCSVFTVQRETLHAPLCANYITQHNVQYIHTALHMWP